MIAAGTITGSSVLRAGADPQTSNQDTLGHAATSEIRGLTNSLLQIRIDADDTVVDDPQEINIDLMPPGGTFTAVAATNVITTSVAHGLAIGDPIKFRSTGVAPAGINTGGTFTALDTTDVITTGAAHGLSVGDEVMFTNSGGALPAGLSAGVSYYVLTTPSATTVTVGLTPEGDTKDITDIGAGTHSWVPIKTYYVLTVPLSTTMTVAAVPGGSTLDITDTGSGTHSFQGYSVNGVNLSYQYPTTGPAVPVNVKQFRSGSPDDFSRVRAIHVALIPTDRTLAASGQAFVEVGDIGTPFDYAHVGLALDFDPSRTLNPPCFWTGALPRGVLYDPTYPLQVKIKEGVSNTNLSVLINLLGN